MNLFENILKAPKWLNPVQDFMSWFQQQPQAPRTSSYVATTQPVSQPVVQTASKPAMTLFVDEKNAYDAMKSDGLGDEEALWLVKKRREQLASWLKLTPVEQTALKQMASDGLSAEESLSLLAQGRKMQKDTAKADFEERYAKGNIGQKALYQWLMLGAWATEKVLQYGGNILDFVDFATWWNAGFWEDVKAMQEVTKSPEFDSAWFKVGRALPDVALAVSPIGGGYLAWARWVWSMALRSGVVWAWFWATQPILDKGSSATMWDIAQWAAIGGTAWAAWGLILWWLVKGWQKIAEAITPYTPEQKIIANLWIEKTKWIVNGRKVNVPVPKEWIITKLSTPLREKNPKVLAWRALTPSYAWKTPKQMLKSVGDVEKNVKDFYTQIRTGKLKWNINTLEDSANTVVQNLDDIGAKIGNAVADVKGNTAISMWTRAEMKKALTNRIEKRAWAYWPLQNFYKDTSKGLSLKDAFKAKKVYQAEIGKLIKAWDAWTDSYSALVKWVQELSDNIDNAVMKNIKWPEFKQWKSQYALLKKLVNDISKSAVVEWRRSPQTFVEQLWHLQAISEWIKNPLSTAKQVFSREIGELNTRGGAWKELIKNYDKQAISAFKKSPKIKVWTSK